jgi:hypothetical protein
MSDGDGYLHDEKFGNGFRTPNLLQVAFGWTDVTTSYTAETAPNMGPCVVKSSQLEI